MQYKRISTSAIVLAIVLALLPAGCATSFEVKNSSSSDGSPSSDVIADGTAYSRKMDGTIINWRDTGCSYSLDAQGNVLLSYNNGTNTCKVPLTFQPGGSISVDTVGFYISSEKTAIAYGDAAGTVTVLISDDMGKTWNNASIPLNGVTASWNCIGFTSQNDGWLVICSFVGMGHELHYIYMTSDGGKTWKYVNGNINDIYSRMLSGGGFVNDEVGFLCFRYESDFQPAICVTRDGGLTWSKLFISLPREYDGYNKTPLSPVLKGTDIVLPVLLTDDNGEAGTIYLISEDDGTTWQCRTALSDENTSPAPSEISTEPAASADPAALRAIKAVLQGNAGFFETGIGKTLNVNQLNQVISSDGTITVKATKFAIIDLDNDGTMEVILWLNVDGLDDYASEILHYQDGVVYGYTMWFRAFNQLKTDGTFSFSGGAMDSGFGTIIFTDKNYSINMITYSQSSYDSNNNLTVSFFVNNKEATPDEFESAIQKQGEKPGVRRYDFTDDNIETVFPDE